MPEPLDSHAEVAGDTITAMESPRSSASLVAVIVLMLAALYLGSYLLLVQPGQSIVWGNMHLPPYRYADGFCSHFYLPLE